jgi:hypothetical protein
MFWNGEPAQHAMISPFVFTINNESPVTASLIRMPASLAEKLGLLSVPASAVTRVLNRHESLMSKT